MNEIKRHVLEGELVDDDCDSKIKHNVLWSVGYIKPTPWINPAMTPEFMERMNQLDRVRQAQKRRFELFLVFCFVVFVVLIMWIISAGYGEYLIPPVVAFVSAFTASASVGFVISRM